MLVSLPAWTGLDSTELEAAQGRTKTPTPRAGEKQLQSGQLRGRCAVDSCDGTEEEQQRWEENMPILRG